MHLIIKENWDVEINCKEFHNDESIKPFKLPSFYLLTRRCCFKGQTFMNFPSNVTPSINPEEICIKMPSYLNGIEARNLSIFIKEHSIPENIRIVHALAHIQLNAFIAYSHTFFTFSSTIPQQDRQQFSTEVKKIALDEGKHCLLLIERLKQLDTKFGDIPVIQSLTNVIKKTEQDLLDRIGLISLLHEGKGRRAVKRLIQILQRKKDVQTVKILKLIEEEQEFHYEFGLKWFKYLCRIRNIDVCKAVEQINRKQKCRLDPKILT